MGDMLSGSVANLSPCLPDEVSDSEFDAIKIMLEITVWFVLFTQPQQIGCSRQ